MAPDRNDLNRFDVFESNFFEAFQMYYLLVIGSHKIRFKTAISRLIGMQYEPELPLLFRHKQYASERNFGSRFSSWFSLELKFFDFFYFHCHGHRARCITEESGWLFGGSLQISGSGDGGLQSSSITSTGLAPTVSWNQSRSCVFYDFY